MNETKEKILEAAFVLLIERGYNGVSIGDISNKLGVARSLPYKYFSSKNDIYFEAFRYYFFDRFFYDIDGSKKISFDEFISIISKRFVEILKKLEKSNVSVFDYNSLYVSALRNEPRLSEYIYSQMDRASLIIDNAYKNGEIVGVPLDFAKRVLYDILGRYTSLDKSDSSEEQLNKIIEDMETFVRLISKK